MKARRARYARGLCPKCGTSRRLTKGGTVAAHSLLVIYDPILDPDDGYREACPGSRKPPRKEVPPRAVAGKRRRK